MPSLIELDVRSLFDSLRMSQSVRGQDVLGPREQLFGSENHFYTKSTAGTLIQTQNFKYKSPYTFRMSRRGFVAFQFTILGSYYRTLSYNANYVSPATVSITNYFEGSSHATANDQRLVGLAILAERDYLTDAIGADFSDLKEPYRSIFTSPHGSTATLEIPLPPDVWMVIYDILECKLAEPLRGIYLGAKTTELLCLVLSQIGRLMPSPIRALATAQRHQHQVAAAASIYRRELHAPPSISNLASRVGLNRNQLNSGFVQQFGLTPNKYSVKLRLEWARSLIEDGDLSLSEISKLVGYLNYSSFCRSYHAYFGASPSGRS
jgi:AraC family transcriptional activator of pyochelin receptor